MKLRESDRLSTLMKWVLAFILLISIFHNTPSVLAGGETVTINTQSLNVRSGPGLTYPVVASLKKGDKAEIVSSSGDWYKIQLNSGTGWVASWLVLKNGVSESVQGTAVSKVDALNIRTEPTLNAAVIGKLSAGETVTVTGRQGQWASISRNGSQGWVHTDYISSVTQQTNGKTTETKNAQQFTVSVNALNVRKEAGLSSKVIGQVHEGDTYPVDAIDGNWVRISMGKDGHGWVYTFHGTLGPKKTKSETASTTKQVTVLTNGTNIRSSATTSSTIVTRADAGDRLTVTGEEGDWYHVTLPSGQSAYIAKWVVSTGNVSQANMTTDKPVEKRVPGTLKGLTIAIDAGHGGHDRGTTGAQGTDEKYLTLKTAELLAGKLRAAGAKVIMTRESDTYIALRKRTTISKTADADAFISLHYDANPDTSITGFTTYYTHSNQKQLATSINDGLANNINLRNRGAQPANFLVLRENRKNSILIELGFLSNPSEERVLITEKFREQATHGIYKGLLAYFDEQ